ncbi:MAG: sugar ABC transporter permease [Betaproteobacteria bacterium]|nr:sugar ABC transporter permease [Betaproteobacteria bacterium]
MSVRRHWISSAFIAPALCVIGLFFFLPVVMGLALSLTDFDIYALADLRNLRFVGLDNYGRLLQLPLFWQSLGNTAYFVVVGVPLSIGLSLLSAVWLQSPLVRFKPLFRTALFAPVVATLVAVAVIWRYLVHVRYGLLNEMLGWWGLDPVDWLGDPRWSMPTVIVFAAWKNFGGNMIILMAALQAIPQELYEAARMDGASSWRRFVDVTLPGLAPTLFMVSVLTTAGYFQLFAEPYVMTQGGPLQSTVSVLYLMYEEGFRWWNLGAASAVAFLLFLIILAVTRTMVSVSRRAGWGAA